VQKAANTSIEPNITDAANFTNGTCGVEIGLLAVNKAMSAFLFRLAGHTKRPAFELRAGVDYSTSLISPGRQVWSNQGSSGP
jgi:hypothetical protein